MARVLDRKLYDFNKIALRDNCFVIVLPETNQSAIEETATQLENTLKDTLDISCDVGTATFPEHAVTFEMLIERAIENCQKVEQPSSIESRTQPALSSTEAQPPTENI